MKVKFKGFQKDDSTRGSCRIKGNLYEPEKEYEVDEGLSNWMFSKDLAVKIKEEVPELFVEPTPAPKEGLQEGLPLHLREREPTPPSVPKTEVKPEIEVEVKPPEAPPKLERKVVEDYVITKLDESRFRVYNILEDKSYVVEPVEQVCTCSDWKFRGIEKGFACKHVHMVQEQYDITPKPIEIMPAEELKAIMPLDQTELINQISPYLRTELIQRCIYEFEHKGKIIRGLTAKGASDLANMLAQKYGINVEIDTESIFLEKMGNMWIARIKGRFGNFETVGVGEDDSLDHLAPRKAMGRALGNLYRKMIPQLLQLYAIEQFTKIKKEIE